MSSGGKIVAEGARRSPYFTEEHEALRDQVRRFVETERNWRVSASHYVASFTRLVDGPAAGRQAA